MALVLKKLLNNFLIVIGKTLHGTFSEDFLCIEEEVNLNIAVVTFLLVIFFCELFLKHYEGAPPPSVFPDGACPERPSPTNNSQANALPLNFSCANQSIRHRI